jgi:hypothetical protein
MYVMLQIFNEINAKKLLPQEVNVFAGLFNNWFFITILLISIVVQVLFVQIKVIATFLKMKPLTTEEYLITVGIGASCIIWGYFIKIFPLEWFGNLQIKEEPLTDEQEAKSLVAVLRKSHRQSVREGARATREFN